MTTLRWENRPVQQTVQTWVGKRQASPGKYVGNVHCELCGRWLTCTPDEDRVCMPCKLVAEVSAPLPLVLIQKAQELLDLQDALRDARADRDRYIARRAELERRLEAVRRSADGK